MFYHIYTSQKALKEPIKVEISTTLIQNFKDYYKNKQNDDFVYNVKQTKELILLPKYVSSLGTDEFYLPGSLMPLFPEDNLDFLKTYD